MSESCLRHISLLLPTSVTSFFITYLLGGELGNTPPLYIENEAMLSFCWILGGVFRFYTPLYFWGAGGKTPRRNEGQERGSDRRAPDATHPVENSLPGSERERGGVKDIIC